MRKNKQKELGQVITPDNIVEQMLDLGGYSGKEILSRHVIDNSCGDGQFLTAIVHRYINESQKAGVNNETISYRLGQFIHGIEIDEVAYNRCIQRLNDITAEYNLNEVDWDIIFGNSLLIDDYRGKMDFVFGNPPYVRVHNVKEEDYDVLKSYSFAEKGSSDLYLAFFELGLQMLNSQGKLCYVTPNSWLCSSSGRNMRNYIIEHRNLLAIVDFEHEQLFDGAQTYSVVTLLRGAQNDGDISYEKYDQNKFQPVSALTYNDIVIDGNFRFVPKEYAATLNEIEHTKGKAVRVKNGLATLSDKIFIDELPEGFSPKFSIPVLKGSTGKWGRCLFPYKVSPEGKLISMAFSDIQRYPELYSYIMSNEKELRKRTYDKSSNWWEIGRSQGLSDTFKNKICVNNLTKQVGDLKLYKGLAGCHVYSGFYILTDYPFETIERALHSEEFFIFVKSLKKYKSGNYYTFSSKDTEKFLNYWIKKYGNK